MTAPTIAAPPAIRRAGSAPADWTEAQLLVLTCLEAARDASTDLTPLDPDWLDMERRHEQLARLNGDI